MSFSLLRAPLVPWPCLIEGALNYARDPRGWWGLPWRTRRRVHPQRPVADAGERARQERQADQPVVRLDLDDL
ncbi:hypothetical protein, partial [Amycolatopsis sp. NPDC004378]